MGDRDIPVGSFGVTATGGWAAWWIRLGTFSRYNHTFIVGPGGRIVEANPSGAEFGHISQYPKARYNVQHEIPEGTRQRIWDNAVALVGTEYHWLDIAALALKFFHISVPWVNRRLQRSDRLICSQLVDLAYRRAGVYLFDDGRLPHDVTPGDLADLLIND